MGVGKTLYTNSEALASDVNSISAWGAIGARPATEDVLAGSLYYDTTNSILYQEQNGSWVAILQIKTLNPANETVDAGYYAATTLSAVDADLAVGNIKKDVVIFGFTGTAKRLEDYAVDATVAKFQYHPAWGTATTPQLLNDNNVTTNVTSGTIGQYVEIVFGDLVKIKRWRQYGDDANVGDGEWKIQYYDLELDAWTDWVTGIATRATNDWSNLSTETEEITTGIRLVVTAVDTQGVSRIGELEVIY